MSDTSQLRKAAVLLASLPDSEAAFLLSGLSFEQLERLAHMTVRLDEVRSNEQDMLAAELASHRDGSIPPKTCASSERRSRAIDTVERTATSLVSSILIREHSQTIATVLAHLSAASAAGLFCRLSTEQQIAVTRRLAHPGKSDKRLIDVLFASIAHQIDLRTRTLNNPNGGETAVAQIINRVDPATERALLSNLAAEDRDLVDRILQRMYVLRDLHRPIQMPQAIIRRAG